MKQLTWAGIAMLCCLIAGCSGNRNVDVLTPGPGSWIVYPSPPRVTPLAGTPMTAVFRREFVLATGDATATITWRCFRAGQLRINGTIAGLSDSSDWAATARIDAAKYLHPGTNTLEAEVSCSSALPAVSVVLEAGGLRLESDDTWESSLAGAVWERARLASNNTDAAPGNAIYEAENIRDAWRASWRLMALFTAIAAISAVLLKRSATAPAATIQFAVVFATMVGLAVLVIHNCRILPAWSGFDASAHLAYVQFLQEHKSLPSANQGWEMFQAPLYYILSAILLSGFDLKALQPMSGAVLCLLNLALGLLGLALTWDALRALFPGRHRTQTFGWLLAAFLPAQIYLTHYPTNEILGAVSVTASLCVCLRILNDESAGQKMFALLGVALAAALASKASSIAVLPAIFLALALNARARGQPFAVGVRNIAVTFGLCGLLGGWHYIRLWRQFGSPFVGNWDHAIGGAWWQQPGFRTPGYYLTFGESLTRPYFSGFHSFWDGLYSTWWGDGCFGGATRLYGRTPWNYNLVTIGFVLALLPSALVLTGLWRGAIEAAFRRRLDWLLLIFSALLMGFAVFVMSVRLPFYSESRAMYALPAMLPFCAFGALGFEWWLEQSRNLRAPVYLCVGVWMITVFTSYWIRPDAIETRLARAVGLFSAARQEAGLAFEKVLNVDPKNPIAVESLAELERDAGQTNEAVRRLEAEARSVTNEIVWTTLALYLGQQGRTPEAMDWATRACVIAPDYPAAPALLCSLALRAGQNDEAARAGQLALRLAPQDYDVQFNVGLALVRLQQFGDAANYFSNALNCSPQAADAHFWLGIALWNLSGKKADALQHIGMAVQLSPQNARWRATLDEMRREAGAR